MLSKFVARAFLACIEVIMWLFLFGCAIGGAIAGADGGGVIGGIGGFIGGAIAGMILEIIFGGALLLYVKLCREVAEIRDDVKKLSTSLASGGGPV